MIVGVSLYSSKGNVIGRFLSLMSIPESISVFMLLYKETSMDDFVVNGPTTDGRLL